MPDQDEGPKPGHFLPGGAGDGAPGAERRRPRQPSLGQPRDVAPPYARPGRQPGPPQAGSHPQPAGERTCDSKRTDVGVYCYGEETVNFPWDRYVDDYKDAPTSTRVGLLADTAALYAFHVMNMVGLADAESGLEDAAASEAARRQLQRRYHLQADCLGASFVGAIRGSFPIRGRTLDRWKAYTTSLIVEDPKTTGSRRNLTLWLRRGFAGLLEVCNTWVAPAKEVS